MLIKANPDVKISRSTFFYLRPANCVPMDSKASHNMCMCPPPECEIAIRSFA
jgi:hypothetical protein